MSEQHSIKTNRVVVEGQYDTAGQYMKFVTPQVGFVFGRSIRDEDGFSLAIKDDYGDWVSPTMFRLGLKCKLEVKE